MTGKIAHDATEDGGKTDEDIEKKGFATVETRVKQDSKITDFLRNFVQSDCEGGDNWLLRVFTLPLGGSEASFNELPGRDA